MGVGTQRYPVHIFRIAVPDRLRALCRSALEHPVRVDCHNAGTGVIGQTDAGDLAFRNVAARLLAVGKMAKCEEQSASKETEKAHPRKNSVVHFSGRVSGYYFDGAIAWRSCADTRP